MFDTDPTVTDEIIVVTYTPSTDHTQTCDRLLSECPACSEHFGLVAS